LSAATLFENTVADLWKEPITGILPMKRSVRGSDLDQFIQVAGDAAYELGVEHGQFTLAGQPVTGDCRVTNIYRRESGAWKIVHHHTDTAQSMIDVLSRLRKKT
jgi:ketosteroid isomerase-like protein